MAADPAQPGDGPVVLVVDGDASRAEHLREALRPHDVVVAPDARAALDQLGERVFLVLSEWRLPDSTGLELLQRCATARPSAVRVLLTDYAELPEIVRARAAGVVHSVVPRTVPARRLATIAGEALGLGHEPSVTAAPPAQDDERDATILLHWTVSQLLRVPGVVIRELPRDPRALQLQFVLPASELPTLQRRLARGWRALVKVAGARTSLRARRHPVVRLLGGLTGPSELHAVPGAGGGWAFIALLPWKREPRVTALLGVLPAGGDDVPALRELFAAMHRTAVQTVPEFAIPRLPDDDEATGVGQPVLEYDWVITPDYAGIDRRHRPTSFFNRFIFVGRRERIPSRHRAVADGFVDRLPRRVWLYAAAWLALSLVDTALTFHFVRAGVVQELNPLLRPLLDAPVVFLVVKNALALAAAALVARLHLWRVGEALLRGVLVAYLALDAWWLWLLIRLS